ncbi:MAG: GAF domain-containing protein [FCB group bacterium]|nr:GAF domain-containing protein [FCB group bacterium]
MPKSANEKTDREVVLVSEDIESDVGHTTDRLEVGNVLAEMEKALNDIVSDNPRISPKTENGTVRLDDLKAVLEISLAINSTLVLDEILQVVMLKAVELLLAERGFVMLLGQDGSLQFKTAHNLNQDEISQESFKISNSIANRVAQTGRSVYTSDAQEDERYANQQSVVELNLRSIMCVPLKINNRVIGVIYLDNSSQAKLFLKSDLFLFELFAQQAAIAIHNAQLHSGLSRLKQYNEDIIAQSPVGIIVIDSDYTLITINEASLKTFQIDRTEINMADDNDQRSRLFDLIPESEQPSWRKMIEIALGGGEFREDRYFHNTGYEEKVLSVKATPTNSLPSNKSGVILVIEDVTEKVVLEKYVILSEKLVAKGEMAASIGHELNNYLTIISNNAELMQINIDRQKYDKMQRNCNQVVENIDKMKRFTDGLMDFSKLETEMVNYDIKHLIENLLFSIKSQQRFKGVNIRLSFDPDLTEISIDVGQIQQVLLNLLNNAVEAMPDVDEPRIDISCRFDHDRDTLKIDVADNGHGMSEEVRQKLFQSHFTTKKDGHGLGLANSRKIILNHKGDITVDSTENKGTTFSIVLPRDHD